MGKLLSMCVGKRAGTEFEFLTEIYVSANYVSSDFPFAQYSELAFRHLRWPRVTIHGVALFPLDVNYYTYLHLQFINLLILFARKTRKPFRKHIWLNTFQDHLKILNVHISRHNYNAALLREINITFTFYCVFPWNSSTSLHK